MSEIARIIIGEREGRCVSSHCRGALDQIGDISKIGTDAHREISAGRVESHCEVVICGHPCVFSQERVWNGVLDSVVDELFWLISDHSCPRIVFRDLKACCKVANRDF